MSKKKKKIETESVIFLLSDSHHSYDDGVMRLVHRSNMYKFYKDNFDTIEFILIPMDDGVQYVILNELPPEFNEFNITFDLYLTSTEYYDNMIGPSLMNEYAPIHEMVYSYDIRCKDIIDYVRFLHSFRILTTSVDLFSMPDDFSTYPCDFSVERAAYAYSSKGKYITDRVRTTDGVVTTAFTPKDFIHSITDIIFKDKYVKYQTMLDGLYDGDCIIINPDKLTWFISPEFMTDYQRDAIDYIDSKFLISVFSDRTGSCIFESAHKISKFIWCDSLVPTYAIFSFAGSACADEYDESCDSLFEFLMNKHGYDYSNGVINIKSLVYGELSDYVENYTVGMFLDANLADAMLVMVNAKAILNSINIVYQKTIGCIVFGMLQIDGSFLQEDESVHCFLCEDIRMMQFYNKSFYDRFSKKLDMVITGDLDVTDFNDPTPYPF